MQLLPIVHSFSFPQVDILSLSAIMAGICLQIVKEGGIQACVDQLGAVYSQSASVPYNWGITFNGWQSRWKPTTLSHQRYLHCRNHGRHFMKPETSDGNFLAIFSPLTDSFISRVITSDYSIYSASVTFQSVLSTTAVMVRKEEQCSTTYCSFLC